MSDNTRMQSLIRLFHTVRHLRIRQVIFQVWFRLYKGTMPSRTNVSLSALNKTQEWIVKPACWQPGIAFTFLNERRSHPQSVQWEQAGASKLWLYNLHYFDCLNARCVSTSTNESTHIIEDYQQCCAVLIEDWITQNTSIDGNAWEPYPTSLRIVNWIKWHVNGAELSEVALCSLAKQAMWLERRLEHHILANHLFANAKALVFAGLFFEGAQAQSWLLRGAALIDAELNEQILMDGGHFELSPMYHSIILEDVLDLLNFAHAAVNRRSNAISAEALILWEKIAEHMLQWQNATVHPDGDIAFFNDTAHGIARSPAELVNYAARVGVISSPPSPASTYLAASGFGVMRKGLMTVIADVGSVGPAYQPGHAHADSLSCEISVGTDRVFVNSGTSTYTKGALRDLQRSTAAHNTLELAGQSSSNVWDGFRVARRAYPSDVVWNDVDEYTYLKANHNGYRFLPKKPRHSRHWLLRSQELQITDLVHSQVFNTSAGYEEQGRALAKQRYQAVVRWLLHPSVEVLSATQLRTVSGHELEWSVEGGEAVLQPALWYSQFGIGVPTQCIVVYSSVGADFQQKFTLRV